MVPICAMFLLFQLITRRFKRTQLLRIISGLVYTYAGLVMFLTGVNVGFMPAGQLIGATIATGESPFLLIPIGMLMGYFIVAAEPAVHVLIKQVEEVSMGSISQTAMRQGMTATFLLPFAMGACEAVGGNLMTDAFGLVALVAMTPLVTIQVLGLAGRVRRKLASDALRAELMRVKDCVLYYD